MGNLIYSSTNSETVAQLRRNDPNVKAVIIRLQQERDAPLAKALERNDHVNEICFKTEQQQDQQQLPPVGAFDSVSWCLLLVAVLLALVQRNLVLLLLWVMWWMAPLVQHWQQGRQQNQLPQQQRWDNLLRVLATREKLEKVHFRGPERAGRLPIITLEHAHASIILHAVQQNPFVGSAKFAWFNLSSGGIVCSFLEDASSLTEFHLEFCSMTEQGAARITASLQRNNKLQTLGLCLDNLHLERILPGLETNTCLQSLSLDTLRSRPFAPVGIEQLLQRTPSIQSLELKNFLCSAEIFQGLICNTTVSTVKFVCCRFEYARNVALFRQMIETKPTLQHLCIRYCHFPEDARLLLEATLQAVLLRPHSPLRTLELIQVHLPFYFPNLTFGALLRAVGRSGLERFCIGRIQSEAHFKTLLSSFPAMQIRELEFHSDDPSAANRQGDVLLSAKQNFSLRSLKASFGGYISTDDDGFDGFSFFTDEDNTRLQFYFDRNKRFSQWVANPEALPRLLWPEALRLVKLAGKDTMYRSLQAVLVDVAESALGQRKRKRRGKRDKTM